VAGRLSSAVELICWMAVGLAQLVGRCQIPIGRKGGDAPRVRIRSGFPVASVLQIQPSEGDWLEPPSES
jgi:hypothetical protein